MSTTAIAKPGWAPWTERVYGRVPLSPVWVGAWIVAFTFVVLVIVSWVGGDLKAYADAGAHILEERDARLALIICVLVGYLPRSSSRPQGLQSGPYG